MEEAYDVVIVGGGPAGLAGALWLARYRLKTLLLDAGNPRNVATEGIHGYLGLEDPAPLELRAIARRQARAAGAEITEGVVERVEGEVDAFLVGTGDAFQIRARRVLFATGLRDIIPEIPGLLDFYGSSIWHCPDCDGPSVAGLRVGVIGWGRQIAAFCMEMLTWTDDLVLLTHGRDPELPVAAREALERFGIPVVSDVIERIEGSDGKVSRIVLRHEDAIEVDAMFFHIAYGPACSIPADLGCQAQEDGVLEVDTDFQTTVPGVYAAGDITHGSKLAIRAAADGTRAAIGIYRSLLPEERRV
ncbi:MAG: NAD(P)/FAD-dependent oxidoreductase [Gemmatimonadota bacterium]